MAGSQAHCGHAPGDRRARSSAIASGRYGHREHGRSLWDRSERGDVRWVGHEDEEGAMRMKKRQRGRERVASRTRKLCKRIRGGQQDEGPSQHRVLSSTSCAGRSTPAALWKLSVRRRGLWAFHKVALGLTKGNTKSQTGSNLRVGVRLEEMMKQPSRLRGRVCGATCQIGGRSLCETPGFLPSLPSRRPCGLGSGMFEGRRGECRKLYVDLD